MVRLDLALDTASYWKKSCAAADQRFIDLELDIAILTADYNALYHHYDELDRFYCNRKMLSDSDTESENDSLFGDSINILDVKEEGFA